MKVSQLLKNKQYMAVSNRTRKFDVKKNLSKTNNSTIVNDTYRIASKEKKSNLSPYKSLLPPIGLDENSSPFNQTKEKFMNKTSTSKMYSTKRKMG